MVSRSTSTSSIGVVKDLEDEEEAAIERADIANDMARHTKAIEAYQKLLNDVARDWKDERIHVIGHVTLSPPICSDYSDEGFTDDWAVVKIYPSMIAKLNFVGNVIDLGSIAVDKLMAWMDPSPSSFNYPGTVFFLSVASFRTRRYSNQPTWTTTILWS